VGHYAPGTATAQYRHHGNDDLLALDFLRASLRLLSRKQRFQTFPYFVCSI
jgi:hypothetical protein